MATVSYGTSLPADEVRGHPALAIYMWVGCGIATVVVAVRLYTRLFWKQAAGWDDLFIALSYLFALVLYVGTQLLLNYGYGRHINYIPPPDLVILLKLNTMVTIAGFAALAFARMSIGLFLLRLVSRVRKWAWVVYLGLSLNVVQAVALILLTGLQCVPIRRLWDPTVGGFCFPRGRFTIADRFFGCINSVVDLIFALFPLLVIRGLQIEGKVKLAIYLLLSCGLLACVCSVGRVVASKLTAQDVTWELIPLTYWALSEATGVLILACMPAMHQIILQFSRSSSWAKMKTYITRKLPGSTHRSGRVSGSGHPANHDGKNRDPITSSKGVAVRRDVYVELEDSVPSDEVAGDTFGHDGRMYSSEARGGTTMV
uniref:Integral membrane protein n=1 Tax=Cladonia uncialis subsp. uncialis TaxID=180999 RepID=A0A1Z1C4F7_CLAUC|nr:integral membrane protein [Cladonia uncialis subsp. uncialis]AUW31381.1 putative integral membrane protein [Cladonia uncialis subsp. uncialis]